MKIILSKDEAGKIIHEALCNGLQWMLGYGLSISMANQPAYLQARKTLVDGGMQNVCREDVYLAILHSGEPLIFYDHEQEESQSFTLVQAIERMTKESCVDAINDMVNHNDDATTADIILQHCLYGEVVFG